MQHCPHSYRYHGVNKNLRWETKYCISSRSTVCVATPHPTCNLPGRTGAVMEDIDLEQQEPFPVDRDGRRFRSGEDRPDGDRKVGCCEKFQQFVSKWMLPEHSRSTYLERANCCPPPIFIILISIAEVALALNVHDTPTA